MRALTIYAALLIGAGLVAAATPAAAELFPLDDIQPYVQARATLLAEGFEGVTVVSGPGRRGCDKMGDRCAAFPEFLGCEVHRAAAFCSFLYRSQYDGRLRVLKAFGDRKWAFDMRRPGIMDYVMSEPPTEEALKDVTLGPPITGAAGPASR